MTSRHKQCTPKTILPGASAPAGDTSSRAPRRQPGGPAGVWAPRTAPGRQHPPSPAWVTKVKSEDMWVEMAVKTQPPHSEWALEFSLERFRRPFKFPSASFRTSFFLFFHGRARYSGVITFSASGFAPKLKPCPDIWDEKRDVSVKKTQAPLSFRGCDAGGASLSFLPVPTFKARVSHVLQHDFRVTPEAKLRGSFSLIFDNVCL